MKIMKKVVEKGLGYKVMDVREEMLRNVSTKYVVASITADDEGIIAGIPLAKKEADKLGLAPLNIVNDGSHVKKGDEIFRFAGRPKQIVLAEEILVGLLAKPSGIATNAHKFVQATDGRPRIVCGAWKKMPAMLKDMIRDAISVGGAHSRIVSGKFVYLDKNYIELLGGIKESIASVAHLEDYSIVVQIKGRYSDIVSEAYVATESGANIVFIDTGKLEDVLAVVDKLVQIGLRDKVKIAFGGGVNIKNIVELKKLDIDILDVGRQIVDAPLLDMRLEIVSVRTTSANLKK